MNGRPQFTPRQILDAGLRAESVSQLDHAAQFFRFLLEHHAEAPEADAARNHLARVSSARTVDTRRAPRADTRASIAAPLLDPVSPPPMGVERGPPASPQPYVNGQGSSFGQGYPAGPGIDARFGGSPGGMPLVAGAQPLAVDWADVGPSPFAAQRGAPSPQPAAHFAAGLEPRAREGSWPAGQPTVGVGPDASGSLRLTLPHVHLPPPVAGYLIGRFMAGALVVLGVVAVLTGIGMVGLSIVRGGGAQQVLAEIFIPGSAIVSGLLLIFAGQSARAVFDGANASRELVTILRAMADPHAGDVPRR